MRYESYRCDTLPYAGLTFKLSKASTISVPIRNTKSSPVLQEVSYCVKQWQKNPPNERMIRESPWNPVKIMPTVPATKKLREFDPATFLATIGEGRKILELSSKQSIFTQGDKADAVFYIQKGKVRLTVLSKTGREATIAILGERIFLARACWRARFNEWDRRQQ